jgi:hypothetical protein
MGQKLEGAHLELYRRTDEVLHYLWDPIGIAGSPEARDEYDGYLGHIFSLLTQDESDEVLRSYLSDVEQNRMGLTITEESRRRLDRAIESLLSWRSVLSGRQK